MKYVFPLSWRSSYVLSTWTFSGTVRVCVCVCSDFLLLLCHLPFHDFYVTLCHSEIICTWFYLVSQSFPLCLLQHCLPSLSPMVFLVFLLDSRAPELSFHSNNQPCYFCFKILQWFPIVYMEKSSSILAQRRRSLVIWYVDASLTHGLSLTPTSHINPMLPYTMCAAHVGDVVLLSGTPHPFPCPLRGFLLIIPGSSTVDYSFLYAIMQHICPYGSVFPIFAITRYL